MIQLQRLNRDSSWWFQVGGLRLVVDPWLVGPEVDYFAWFNTQFHGSPPVPVEGVPDHDVVLITQKYTDHLHPETLRSLDPKEVWVVAEGAAKIRSILPNAAVREFSAAEPVQRRSGCAVRLLPTRRRLDPLYQSFWLDDGEQGLLYAPHSLAMDEGHRESLNGLPGCAVLITSLRGYRLPTLLGGMVSPGLAGAEALVQALRPARVIPTHDEDKPGRGLVPWLAKVTPFDPDSRKDHAWLHGRFEAWDDYDVHALAPEAGAER